MPKHLGFIKDPVARAQKWEQLYFKDTDNAVTAEKAAEWYDATPKPSTVMKVDLEEEECFLRLTSLGIPKQCGFVRPP